MSYIAITAMLEIGMVQRFHAGDALADTSWLFNTFVAVETDLDLMTAV